MNNQVTLSGILDAEFKPAYTTHGEQFFSNYLKVERASGIMDILPIIVSERVILDQQLKAGSTLTCTGQFRSMNKFEGTKSKLILYVLVQKIYDGVPEQTNNITLTGYLCKPTNYRLTPFDREISDMLIAVNRKHKCTDYLPCIAWGRNAKFVENLPVGTKLAITGRIQSRNYNKKINETDTKAMTAYEVSISSIVIVEAE
jgi:primosomal replication protein N